MIDVQRTHWEQLRIGAPYFLNKEHVKSMTSGRDKYIKRIGCLLVLQSISTGIHRSRDIANFRCLSGIRQCRTHPRLAIRRSDVNARRAFTSGNLIVRVYTDTCHACGNYSDRCLITTTRHLVCTSCIGAGRTKPPFAYSTASPTCCKNNECGNKKGHRRSPYDMEDVELYRKAVAIQRKCL